ncbi:MBL fold metallo-hydrolase [Hahella sp. CCB-MM4]|uniref:MBL fold metallo-hydrolase n=1 Tax=Hahella sp. (strain CCB-MM4) TaxID=1926491 RepID=UPI000B9C1466|nr:MBL fold metallo-hydrolase [Hahella sp. CCB-MM4]OZG73039.1 MBL fold metallo-hydrolase [Hahella sp. CCB-MM4]
MDIHKIIQIPILPAGMVNSHLVLGNRGAILVDAGLPGSEARISKKLSEHGLGFQDIKLIVITHAHVDHAGNALRLRELCRAPVVGHAGDLPFYRQEKQMTFCPTGWFGRLFKLTRAIQQPYQAFEPDILLHDNDSLHLQDYGINGEVRHTPGHTAGSVSVELSDQQALVGDLIASGILLGGIFLKHRPKQPPFEDNPIEVGRTLRQMVERGHHTFYMGHGGPLPATAVKRHASRLCCHDSA